MAETDMKGGRRGSGGRAIYVLGYLLITLLAAVVVYVLFSIFFRTDTERMLRREIRMYERIYPELAERAEMTRDAVAALQHKDNEIYERIFHTDAPGIDPMGRLSFLHAGDTIPDSMLNDYAARKADSLLLTAAGVDAVFREIFAALADSSLTRPPMLLPLENVSYPQTGASIGSRLDPFYKAYVWHEGLDFIVDRGTPVYATAAGVVSSSGSSKKSGSTVEITHEGGYERAQGAEGRGGAADRHRRHERALLRAASPLRAAPERAHA